VIITLKASIDLEEVGLTGPRLKPKIWTAKLRTVLGADNRASASKISNAAALIVLEGVVAAGAAVTALEAAVDLIASVAADLAVAGSGADGNHLGLEFSSDFSYNQKLSQPTQNKTYEKTINTNKYRHRGGGIGTDHSV
jgi:hypothetical protein